MSVRVHLYHVAIFFLFLKQYSLEIVKPVVMVMDSAREQDAGMFNLMP